MVPDDFPITMHEFHATAKQIDSGGEPVYCQVIAYKGIAVTRLPLSYIRTVFQRGLNTWADAPKELIEFCDALDQL